MVLLGYEGRANIDVNGDLHIVGDKLLVEKDFILQRKATIKAKHFTVIGITKLLGEPIYFIAIIEGKEQLFGILAGIDLFKKKVVYESDGEEEFRMNVVSVKYHPGGTSCTYKWKTESCLVRFSKSGGISGHIIMNILRHLYGFKLYDNDSKNGIIPELLVDVHVSHFDMWGLKYVCGDNHKWTLVFSVPHGT